MEHNDKLIAFYSYIKSLHKLCYYNPNNCSFPWYLFILLVITLIILHMILQKFLISLLVSTISRSFQHITLYMYSVHIVQLLQNDFH